MSSANKPPADPARRWLIALALLLAGGFFVLIIISWSGEDNDIDTWYGHRSGTMGAKSVNGTAVLADMFVAAGHRVRSWQLLSPSLEKADTIVWFPDRFEPPGEEARVWLEDWLYEEEGRTLIYVGRDYDAAPHYWQTIRPSAPKAQQAEISRLRVAAKSSFTTDRTALPKLEDCDWFELDGKTKTRKVRSLKGPWSGQVDASKLEIELNSRIAPPQWSEVLLESKGDVLASRQIWEGLDESQLIVVANGSFLLNLPLVNHEHRKLAGHLINEVSEPGSVVFLESGPDDIEIREEDPSATMPTGMEFFSIWPLNYILLHLVALGLFFAFARSPIFGIAKHTAQDSTSDFGKHVTSLGKLLENTGDVGYAHARIKHYQQAVLGETPTQLPQTQSSQATTQKPDMTPDSLNR